MKKPNEAKIEGHFREIMRELGLDVDNDPSLRDTPKRVAKMYAREIFNGLFLPEPEITAFPNTDKYDQIVVQNNISVKSVCEHHFVPIIGYCHIAYKPEGSYIGLSKMNRIVQFYMRRPQVQEKLTQQIANHLKHVLQTEDVAVVIEAEHMCVKLRGVEDENSTTRTIAVHGIFREIESAKQEFLSTISDARSKL